MQTQIKPALFVSLVFIAIALTAFLIWNRAQGAVTKPVPAQPAQLDAPYTFFSATTTTATSTNKTDGSGYKVIAAAKKVTFYLSRGGATNPNTGSTNFRVQVTPNGDDWYYFEDLVSATSTNTYTQIALTGTSTAVVSMSNEFDAFYAVRVIAVETTDGEHTATVSVEH